MSRGLRPLRFREPLPIPNGQEKLLAIQNVELTFALEDHPLAHHREPYALEGWILEI